MALTAVAAVLLGIAVLGAQDNVHRSACSPGLESRRSAGSTPVPVSSPRWRPGIR
ncbi:hypothetical protein ACWD25_31945 [Streptomyces sp. NPDC002920]